MPVTERRDFPRQDTRTAAIRAWLSTEENGLQPCRVVELSRKGILLKSSQALRPGSTVQVVVAYSRGANVTRLFRRWTRVVRRTPSGYAAVFTTQPRNAKGTRRNATP